MKEFAKELAALMEKHGVATLGAAVTGDTHGVRVSFYLEDVHGKETTVEPCQSWICARELREFAQ